MARPNHANLEEQAFAVDTANKLYRPRIGRGPLTDRASPTNDLMGRALLPEAIFGDGDSGSCSCVGKLLR